MTSDPDPQDDGPDIMLAELYGGRVPDEGAPADPPQQWIVVAMIEDGAVDAVLTTAPYLHGGDRGGPQPVVVVPGDRVGFVALRTALSVWQRDDGLYRYSAPVEALCDGLRQLAVLDDHHEAAVASARMLMDVSDWWTSTRAT